MHNNRKLQTVPQLDGENSDNRDKDCWWEKKLSNFLKMFYVFKDVLMDIKKSPLNEEENILQHDNVTNARKGALGSIKLPVHPSLELPVFIFVSWIGILNANGIHM